MRRSNNRAAHEVSGWETASFVRGSFFHSCVLMSALVAHGALFFQLPFVQYVRCFFKGGGNHGKNSKAEDKSKRTAAEADEAHRRGVAETNARLRQAKGGFYC